MFNKILLEGEFPKSWNRGYIVPLHKSGNARDPNNFRGLTINSCLSKAFTSILNERLQKYLHVNDIINKYQIGFAKKSQTSDHMLVLKTIADKYKAVNKKIYFGFVDFKKAYDTVWRDGLLYKLLKNGINGKFYNVIESMYQTSECCVKVDQAVTEFFKNNIGVKQGEVLSPLLFNLYVNDLPSCLSDPESPSLNGSQIDCLLYADDLVLMSTTKSGLQRKFDKLNQYCSKWRLCVNTDKTMVMQVSKTGKLPKKADSIVFNNCHLEYTNTYKYLGVVFDSAGNFNQARNNMYERGQKALFKLKSVIDRDFLSPKISLDLFDKTVKPVCLYGSEIWSCLNVSNTILNNNAFIEHLMKKYQVDKVNISFCKWLLGIHKYSSNLGVLGELGRYPFIIDIIKMLVKYWIKLRTKRSYKSLLHDCLCEAELIDASGGQSWLTWLKFVCKMFGISDINNVSVHDISSKIRSSFDSFWIDEINKNSKLRTYCTIKGNFRYEDYLDTLQFNERRLLAKLRLSSHSLKIETGRHTRPVTPVEERKCNECSAGVTEDEYHVIMSCERYTDKRQVLINAIIRECPLFDNLDDSSKFYYIMNLSGPALRNLAQLVQFIFARDNPRRSPS